MHVLIAGAGIIGLTVAHGLTKRGISYTIFDKEEVSHPQGWGLTLQWGLDKLLEVLPPEVVDKIESCAARRDAPYAEGGTCIVNAETGEVLFPVPMKGRILRVNRRKFWDVLSTGVDVKWNKELIGFKATADSVTVTIKDGTTFTGDILIGADGASSVTRKLLLGELGALTRLPFRMSANISRWPYSAVEKALSYNKWFYMCADPRAPTSLFVSLQEVFEPEMEGGEKEVELLQMVTRRLAASDLNTKYTPDQDREIVKKLIAHHIDALKHITLDPPANAQISYHTFADWVPVPYEAPYSRVFLAGDAAHTMVPFRGEGVNYGLMTTANLLQHLYAVDKREETLSEAFTQYEAFTRAKAVEGVTRSRMAIYDAHDFSTMNADSPFLKGRGDNPEATQAEATTAPVA